MDFWTFFGGRSEGRIAIWLIRPKIIDRGLEGRMAIWFIRPKIIDRGLEGRMAIWLIRPKFCWELNLTNRGKF